MDELARHLRNLEECHMLPEVRKNPVELAKVLAEGFFEIGSSGMFVYREDCLVEGGISVWDVIMTDFETHPLAEGLVLTTYRVEDRTRNRNTLRSSIWKLIDGQWQMVFHQGTIENYKG